MVVGNNHLWRVADGGAQIGVNSGRALLEFFGAHIVLRGDASEQLTQ